MSNFKQLCDELQSIFQTSYEEGTTLEQAERLAARFNDALMDVSKELARVDLDSRTRKQGVKAIRATLYLDAASKGDKKPTEAMLNAILDSNDIIAGEQERLDKAEVETAELKRYYDIFTNAHIYYRGVAKGNFGG